MDNDPTAHAELVAMRQAAERMGNHRLVGCAIFATIEPCAMWPALWCTRVWLGWSMAKRPKAGAAGSVLQVINDPALNHRIEVTSGVHADKCSEVLTSCFRSRREDKKNE